MISNCRTRGSWELWLWNCRRDVRRFKSALRNPEAAQIAHLRSILSLTANSLWARRYGIDAQSTLDEFRERVPVLQPEDLSAWTDRILLGEAPVLSTGLVERLVPTSGTTGEPKLIPMTPQSRREFSIGVNLWLSDTMRNFPGIKSGRCYIATSPALDIDLGRTSAVPVGFAADATYLGSIERKVLNHVVAVPGSVAGLRGAAWRAATRHYLMQARNLRFLSLWHPGYLDALFDAEELAELAEKWANLTLISSWADGACAEPARRLIQNFPQAHHVPKGLWLTEGIVTVPWHSAHPIALLSGFFEFEDDEKTLHLAHELKKDAVYRPVITNHSGLYRYRLGDLIKVTGYVDRTPSLRWIGRADQVSDLCGEKLSEAQVAQAFEAIGWNGAGILKPARNEKFVGYVCLIRQDEAHRFPAERLDEELRRNPHYDWARTVGQIGPLEVQAVPSVELSSLKSEEGQTISPHRKGSRLMLADVER